MIGLPGAVVLSLIVQVAALPLLARTT